VGVVQGIIANLHSTLGASTLFNAKLVNRNSQRS
jgi:hypothetical protein